MVIRLALILKGRSGGSGGSGGGGAKRILEAFHSVAAPRPERKGKSTAEPEQDLKDTRDCFGYTSL